MVFLVPIQKEINFFLLELFLDACAPKLCLGSRPI